MTRVGSHLAAIDVGTNSFHLVVVRITADGYDVVARRRASVRLGQGGLGTGRLTPDAIDRGIDALRRMSELAAAHDAPVRAVATSAVRDATNADEFLGRARSEAGIDVEVVSGTEEARLIHLGVLEALPIIDRRMLVIDIGGGSTEIVLGAGHDLLAATSLPVGAVRLTDRYFPGGQVGATAVDACRSHIAAVLTEPVAEFARLGFDLAIASSGTAQTVAAMVLARFGEPVPPDMNGLEIDTAHIDAIVEEAASRPTAAERTTIPGLDARRADIIVAGALVLQSIVDALDITSLTLSSGALREGIVADTLSARHGRTAPR